MVGSLSSSLDPRGRSDGRKGTEIVGRPSSVYTTKVIMNKFTEERLLLAHRLGFVDTSSEPLLAGRSPNTAARSTFYRRPK